jgi:hypothetical protein
MRESHSAVTPAHDSSDSKQILHTSGAVREIERRLFLKQGLSLGALTLLTGCDVTDTSAVQSVLDGISRWNDRTQAAIFNPRRLMPTYPESQRSVNRSCHSASWHRRLLSMRRQWPGGCSPAQKRDELAPPHSITSSVQAELHFGVAERHCADDRTPANAAEHVSDGGLSLHLDALRHTALGLEYGVVVPQIRDGDCGLFDCTSSLVLGLCARWPFRI